jgi:hypothetical protein
MSIGPHGEGLIFLVSQPRAGSTLLQRILASHPEVHTTAEPWLMLHLVYGLRQSGHLAEYDAEATYAALRGFLGTLEGELLHYVEALRRMASYLYGIACTQAGKTYFLDKTPRYYLILPDLIELFPEARFVFLLRNPLAVLASILETWVRGNWIKLSRHHLDLVAAPKLLLEGIRLLEEQAVVIHYESLVVEPAAEVEALCAQLDLRYYPDMLEYGRYPPPQGRAGDPIGVHKHVRPTPSSLDQWLQLGRGEQTRHLAEQYTQSLGSSLLSDLGYDCRELQAGLQAVPCTQKGMVVPWQRVFAPEQSRRNKFYLVTAELVQKRDVLYSGKLFVKLLLGRL